ncbi:MAG: COR domain-containing protein, partial [Phycisphaerales bacterium]
AREIAKLAQLTSLDLWGNSIGDEGAREIAKLDKLTSLILNDNSIGAEGAREIAKLAQLTSLILNDNSIGAEGAREIAKLAQLTSLSLSSNSIGAEGAREIAKLAQLTSLDLWSNSIGDEGAREIARLDKLTSLNLNHNSIGPEGAREIAKLAQLTSLNLSSNSIGDKGAAALLDTIGETFGVRRLTRLHLHGNGITNIPEDILNRADAAAIVAYWVERKSGVPLHEAKVLLLGDGESGKTHVRHRVFGGTPRYVERTHVMTHGISRTDDEFECELQGVMERVRVRAWDFGGQRTLHGSHRFFMTRERSLYVLVLDATKSLAANHGRTWLRMIRHHSHHGVQDHRLVAPMMIVLTKCDRAVEHRVDALAREAMTAAEEIGCRVVGEAHRLGWMPAEGGAALTGEARDAERRHEEAVVRLRDAIAQVIPEVVGLLTQGFSRVVSGIMEGIESRFDPEATTTPGSNEDARKQIGWDVFTEMFTSSGSSADYARIVGTVFRSLGIVHFVTDDEIVRDTRGTTSLIFNPMWLKGPVYTLLRTPSEAHKGGMISPENVATVMRPDAPYGTDDPDEKASLWRRLSFTADDRARVIDLMRSCEIVFDVEERGNVRGSIIVPDLLQTSEGKGPPHSITAKGEIRLEYLPTNLLARLMGRWNDRLVRDRSCSVYDAQFSSGDRRLRARVRTDTEESVIQVDIWAGEDGKERAPAKEDAEHFYRAIADEVREIAPTRRDGGQADVVPGPLQMPYRMTTGGKAGLIALAAVSLIAGTVLAVLWHGDQRTEGFVVRTLFGVGVACLAMLAPWERFVVSIPLTGWKLRLPMGAVAFLVVFVFGTPNMLGGVRGVLEAIGQLILKK